MQVFILYLQTEVQGENNFESIIPPNSTLKQYQQYPLIRMLIICNSIQFYMKCHIPNLLLKISPKIFIMYLSQKPVLSNNFLMIKFSHKWHKYYSFSTPRFTQKQVPREKIPHADMAKMIVLKHAKRDILLLELTILKNSICLPPYLAELSKQI